MSAVVRVRRARKLRPACGGYCPAIQPGYATAAGHPVRMTECRTCAEQYGRGHLIQEREHQPA